MTIESDYPQMELFPSDDDKTVATLTVVSGPPGSSTPCHVRIDYDPPFENYVPDGKSLADMETGDFPASHALVKLVEQRFILPMYYASTLAEATVENPGSVN